jgi:magnesium transporter
MGKSLILRHLPDRVHSDGTLVGVVLWGCWFDRCSLVTKRWCRPAAFGPFVATLVDVTGLVIYFSMAALILRGTIL